MARYSLFVLEVLLNTNPTNPHPTTQKFSPHCQYRFQTTVNEYLSLIVRGYRSWCIVLPWEWIRKHISFTSFVGPATFIFIFMGLPHLLPSPRDSHGVPSSPSQCSRLLSNGSVFSLMFQCTKNLSRSSV